MNDLKDLEAVWLGLGREERRLEEALAAAKVRVRQYRLDGEDEAADVLGEAMDRLRDHLAEVKALISTVVPVYFAAVNGRKMRR